MRPWLPIILACCTLAAGCGTTKWTDTSRTATEQLLISDAMDRAVAKLDLRAVAGKTVYLDSTPIAAVTDSAYLISLLRQHMLATGCIVKENRDEADYVLEVRAGAVGTDRRDVMFGVPATQVGGMLPLTGVPSSIPEMPLAKKTQQRAVVKIAVFAYNRKTGRPVWQSGSIPVESTAKHVWVLGAGPFERGSIFTGTNFVGNRLKIPLVSPDEKRRKSGELVAVTEQAFFDEPEEKAVAEEQIAEAPAKATPGEPAADESAIAAGQEPVPASGKVVPAGHAASVAPPPSEKPTAAPVPPEEPPASEPPASEPPLPDPPQPPPRLLPQDGPVLRLLPRGPIAVLPSGGGLQPLLGMPESSYLPPGFPDLPYELPLKGPGWPRSSVP